VTDVVLEAPRTLEELASALGLATDRTRLVAGATDLTLRLRSTDRSPDRMIDLGWIPQLRGISLQGDRIRVGAMASFQEIAASACVQQHASCLAAAAGRVGSVQVRGMATIGGNVANASACADGVTPLIALAAEAGVLTAGGTVERRPIATLFAATGGSALSPSEAVIDFGFQALRPLERSAFAKLGVRTSIAVSRLNVAAVLVLSPNRSICLDARLAFGSLGTSPRLAEGVAAVLVGQRIDDELLAELAQRSSEYVDQAIPDRLSRAYKRRAVRGLMEDLWRALFVGEQERARIEDPRVARDSRP
jgi:CO/xanthine dehydrogenase FAD-binding subunit